MVLQITYFPSSDYQADMGDRALPETLSQVKSAALVENNTLDENATDSKRYSKDDDPDEKGEKDHPNYGHVDEKQEYFPPRFKHPTKMFKMDMKPAGNSIRLRCAAEGKKICENSLGVVKVLNGFSQMGSFFLINRSSLRS